MVQGCGPLQLLFEQQCLYLHDSAVLSHTPLLNRWQSFLEIACFSKLDFFSQGKVMGCSGFAAASVKQRTLHCVAMLTSRPVKQSDQSESQQGPIAGNGQQQHDGGKRDHTSAMQMV